MTKVLVTVAHPDDETFGTGSVIAAAAAAGAEVTVCCATRGEAGEAVGLSPGEDLGTLREAELRAAGELVGAAQVVLLGYRDSGMTGDAAAGTLAAAAVDEVAARVDEVIRDVNPDVVITLDADHGDGHRDHVAIARATIQACGAHPAIRLYSWVLPRPLLTRWFAELERVRPDSEHLDLDQQGIGRPEEQITTVLDHRALRPLREQAFAMHASQRPPVDGMPEELRSEFLETDYLVRLQPPWTGGSRETSLF
jgi:N-acetyl-1-D-myo-inositol-2-amino-2-deoxy-alpha-D-glucopyranoside deacetylase